MAKRPHCSGSVRLVFYDCKRLALYVHVRIFVCKFILISNGVAAAVYRHIYSKKQSSNFCCFFIQYLLISLRQSVLPHLILSSHLSKAIHMGFALGTITFSCQIATSILLYNSYYTQSLSI